jgi:hypothetical protein
MWTSEDVPACPPVHRQDEPARLSLGVVPKCEAVKCKEILYSLSLEILYTSRVHLPLQGLQVVAIEVTIGSVGEAEAGSAGEQPDLALRMRIP